MSGMLPGRPSVAFVVEASQTFMSTTIISSIKFHLPTGTVARESLMISTLNRQTTKNIVTYENEQCDCSALSDLTHYFSRDPAHGL